MAAERLRELDAAVANHEPLPEPRWSDGIELHAAQIRVLESIARFVVACAGARGGKTKVGARRFALRIWRDHIAALAAGRRFSPVMSADGIPTPLLRYWVIAPTYALTQVAQQELTAIFLASGWNARWEDLSHGIHHRCWLGDTGVLIEFKSADNPASLVSHPTHGQWWDEGAKVAPDRWYGNARQRLTDTGGWALFTSTPMGPGFYLDLFQHGADASSRWHDPTKRDDEWESVWWCTADNPHPLVKADVEKARATLPKRYFDREYMASFDAYQGQVYEEFAADHIIDDVGRFDEVIGGVDFGHSAPGCVLVVGVRRRFAPNGKPAHRYHVLAEVYADRWVTSQWIDATLKLCTSTRPQITALYCDPAGAQLIADWKNAGLPVATHPSINDVSGGIRHMATLFAQGRLTVSPKCVNLIRELRAYRYREDSAGNTIDVVVKANDHAPDAARYALFADHLRHAA